MTIPIVDMLCFVVLFYFILLWENGFVCMTYSNDTLHLMYHTPLYYG